MRHEESEVSSHKDSKPAGLKHIILNPSCETRTFNAYSNKMLTRFFKVISFGPTSDLFGAENVTSIWGINFGHGLKKLEHSCTLKY